LPPSGVRCLTAPNTVAKRPALRKAFPPEALALVPPKQAQAQRQLPAQAGRLVLRRAPVVLRPEPVVLRQQVVLRPEPVVLRQPQVVLRPEPVTLRPPLFPAR